MSRAKWKVGDLVWVRVASYPTWPGQVMDPKDAPKQTMKERKSDTQKLVSFFADNSFGWFEDHAMIDFGQHFDKYRIPSKAHKDHKQAVEEAKEILDRRAGREPATNHQPFDFTVDAIEIDPDDPNSGLIFEERHPPLPKQGALALDPEAVVAKLRQQARSMRGLQAKEPEATLVLWARCFRAPKAVRKAMVSTKREAVEPVPAPKKRGRKPAEEKVRKSTEEKDQNPAASRGAGRPRGKGTKKSAGLSLQDAKRAFGGSPDSDHKAKKRRKTLKESLSSKQRLDDDEDGDLDSDGGDGRFSSHAPSLDVLAAAAADLEAPTSPQAGPRRGVGSAVAMLPWSSDVHKVLVGSSEQLAELEDDAPDEVNGLLEKLSNGEVKLNSHKVKIRKIVSRLRQYARHAGSMTADSDGNLADTFSLLFNEHSLAALYKLREGCAQTLRKASPSNSSGADAGTPSEAGLGAEAAPAKRQVGAGTISCFVDVWRAHQAKSAAKAAQDPNVVVKPPPPWPYDNVDPEATGSVYVLKGDFNVPLYVYKHLSGLSPAQLPRTEHDIRRFWWARGLSLPVAMYGSKKYQSQGLHNDSGHAGVLGGPVQLDVGELFHEVAMRGGFWACCAAQGDGKLEHQFERHIAWRLLAYKTWIANARIVDACVVEVAAQLQEWYRVWLLPYERHLLREHAAEVATLELPASLIRALTINRDHDSTLLAMVRGLCKQLTLEGNGPHVRPGQHLKASEGFEAVAQALVHKLGPVETADLLEDHVDWSSLEASKVAGFEVPATKSPKAGASLKAKKAAPGMKAKRRKPVKSENFDRGDSADLEDKVALSEDDAEFDISDDSDDGEDVKPSGPRWARGRVARGASQRPKARSTVRPARDVISGSKRKQGARPRRAEVGKDDIDASFLAGAADVEDSSDTLPRKPHPSGSLVKEDSVKEEGSEAPPKPVLNPLKRQRPGSESADRDAGGEEALEERRRGKCCVQIFFPQAYKLPMVSQVNNLISRRFPLSQRVCDRSSVVSSESCIIVTFTHEDVARDAAAALPELLRSGLHKHASYQIRTRHISGKEAKAIVLAERDQRRSYYTSGRSGAGQHSGPGDSQNGSVAYDPRKPMAVATDPRSLASAAAQAELQQAAWMQPPTGYTGYGAPVTMQSGQQVYIVPHNAVVGQQQVPLVLQQQPMQQHQPQQQQAQPAQQQQQQQQQGPPPAAGIAAVPAFTTAGGSTAPQTGDQKLDASALSALVSSLVPDAKPASGVPAGEDTVASQSAQTAPTALLELLEKFQQPS